MGFSIFIDTASLSKSSLGQIAGVVSANFDGTAFPERHWSDSIVIVFIGLMDALGALASGTSATSTVHFMDGPFRMEMERHGDIVQVHAIESMREDVNQAEATVSWAELRHMVIDAAGRVIRACRENGWHSRDLSQLEQRWKATAAHLA